MHITADERISFDTGTYYDATSVAVDDSHDARHAIGETIRRLRQRARLSGQELATRAGMSQSKISRIECGQSNVTEQDVLAIGGALRLSADVVANLIVQVRQIKPKDKAHHPFEWEPFDSPEQFREIEAQAREVSVLTPFCLPALLHTEDYARACAKWIPFWLDEEQHYRAIIARFERQAQLRNPEKSFRFLVTTASLQKWIGSPAIMCDQLRSTLGAIQRPNVEMRCIPPYGESKRDLTGSVVILDNGVVMIDTATSILLLRGRREIAAYTDTFETLWHDALRQDDVISIIHDVLQQLDSHIDVRSEAVIRPRAGEPSANTG